jgi:hypothetical protein
MLAFARVEGCHRTCPLSIPSGVRKGYRSEDCSHSSPVDQRPS